MRDARRGDRLRLALARNTLHPQRRAELWRKARHHLAKPRTRREAARAVAWAQDRVATREMAMPDAALRAEAEAVGTRIRDDADRILPTVPTAFGGGGDIELLYYLVREHEPAHVLETGVAAGWSSRAILEAMTANGNGHLWSSDLPYLRQPGSDASIGCLVPQGLRGRWTLLLDGDRANVPALLTQSGPIDLVHYDSDKSRGGRDWLWRTVQPALAPGALLVMDDIHEDCFFADLVTQPPRDHLVLETGGKPLGVLRL